VGVRIFTADIIYHLFDQFTAYMQRVKDEKKQEAAEEAVFPVVLKILPNCIFNKKDPIVLGVEVLDGVAKVRPLCPPPPALPCGPPAPGLPSHSCHVPGSPGLSACQPPRALVARVCA